MKIILPVFEPLITSYAHHTAIFSVIESLDEKSINWVANNILQIQIKNIKPYNMDFCGFYNFHSTMANCPWIHCNTYDRNIVYTKWSSYIDFIKEHINLGYYVFVVSDEYYIKEYDNYNRNHSYHPQLIYGYDDDKKLFYIGDFFKKRKYYYATAEYTEIENAMIKPENDYLYRIFIYKKQKKIPNFTLSIKCIKNYLEDYYFSRNSNYRNSIQYSSSLYDYSYAYTFGLNIYDVLQTAMNRNGEIDYTVSSVLIDHKTIVIEVIKYLNIKGYVSNSDIILNEYEYLRNQLKIIQNLLIKLKISNNKQIVVKIINYFSQIKRKEQSALKLLLDSIHDTAIPPFINEAIENNINNVSFINIDRETSGNWIGKYGNNGYIIPGRNHVIPTHINCFLSDVDLFNIKDETEDPRALCETDNSEQKRSINHYSHNPYFDVHLYIKNNDEQFVSLYVLDWSRNNYTGSIQLLNGKTLELLCDINIEKIENGTYYTFEIKGYIIIRFKYYVNSPIHVERYFGNTYGIFFD